MSLAQVVATAQTTRNGPGIACSVGTLIDGLTGEDLDALLFLLYGDTRAPGGWGRPAREVHDLVKAAGLTVSLQQINRHRGGSCRCASEGIVA